MDDPVARTGTKRDHNSMNDDDSHLDLLSSTAQMSYKRQLLSDMFSNQATGSVKLDGIGREGAPRASGHPLAPIEEDASKGGIKITKLAVKEEWEAESAIDRRQDVQTSEQQQRKVSRHIAEKLPRSQPVPQVISYVCQGPAYPGKFDPEAATALGLKPGKEYGALVGENLNVDIALSLYSTRTWLNQMAISIQMAQARFKKEIPLPYQMARSSTHTKSSDSHVLARYDETLLNNVLFFTSSRRLVSESLDFNRYSSSSIARLQPTYPHSLLHPPLRSTRPRTRTSGPSAWCTYWERAWSRIRDTGSGCGRLGKRRRWGSDIWWLIRL